MRALLLALATLVGCASEEQAEEPNVAPWLRAGGDGSSQFAYGIAVAANGDVVVVGEFGGALDFGAGRVESARGQSGYVAKFARDGTPLFTKRVGEDASAYTVAIDERAHIFVGGYFRGSLEGRPSKGETDAYVLELDGAGNTVAAKSFGDAKSQVVTSIALDGDELVVAGDFSGSIELGGATLSATGETDLFLARFGADFAHRFSKRFGSTSIARRPRLAVDSASIYLAATYRDRLDLGGGPLEDAFDGACLARFSPDGTHAWSRALAGDGFAFPTAVALGDGGVAMSARFTKTLPALAIASESGEDALVASYDSEGNLRFAKRFGGFGQDAASSLVFDARGDLYVAGELLNELGPLTSVGASDAFVARLDRTGAIVWSDRLGDAEGQRATRIARDPRGGIVVTGTFFGEIEHAGARVRSAGGFDPVGGDVFVARYTF